MPSAITAARRRSVLLRRHAAGASAPRRSDAERENGSRAMRHLEIDRRCVDRWIPPAERNGRTRDRAPGNLGSKAAERDGDDRQMRRPRARARRTRSAALRGTRATQRAGANCRRRNQRQQRHRNQPMRDGRPGRIAHLHCHPAEDGGAQHGPQRAARRSEHPSAPADASFTSRRVKRDGPMERTVIVRIDAR